jgi:hypothetical protein
MGSKPWPSHSLISQIKYMNALHLSKNPYISFLVKIFVMTDISILCSYVSRKLKNYNMSHLVTEIIVAFTSLCMLYLKTLSVAQTIESQIVGLLVKN